MGSVRNVASYVESHIIRRQTEHASGYWLRQKEKSIGITVTGMALYRFSKFLIIFD